MTNNADLGRTGLAPTQALVAPSFNWAAFGHGRHPDMPPKTLRALRRSPDAITRSSCSAGPGLVRHIFPSIMPNEDQRGAITIPGQISRHTPREITPITYTKQTVGIPISRHKIGTPAIANFALVLTHDSTSDPTRTFAHV